MTEAEARERFEALYRGKFPRHVPRRAARPPRTASSPRTRCSRLFSPPGGGWTSFSGARPPRGWLFKALRNTVGDTLRALERLRALTAGGVEADAAVYDERGVLLEYESAQNRAELELLVRVFCEGESCAGRGREPRHKRRRREKAHPAREGASARAARGGRSPLRAKSQL